MKAIIDGVMYNTRRAKRIHKYVHNYKRGGFLSPVERWHERVVLYRTKDGTYFEHVKNKNVLRIVEEDQVMEYLKNVAPGKYMKMFEPGMRKA